MKKHFWNYVYFQIVTVIPVSSLVLAVCERQSYTGYQQAFSALARDSASHPYPNRSNMPTFVHCGVYSDVCRRIGFCVCTLLGMGRCGNMRIFFYLSLFSFLKIFVVSGLSEKNPQPYLEPQGSVESPKHSFSIAVHPLPKCRRRGYMQLCLLTLMVSAELLRLCYMLTHTQNTASSDLLGDSSVAVMFV